MSNIIQVAPATTDLALVAQQEEKRGRGGKGFGHEKPGGGSVEWYTPNWVMQGIGLQFDMDLASPEAGPPFWMRQWITSFVTPSMDGLKVEIPKGALLWNNPPYGDLTGPFFERMANANNGMGLVFCRPGSEWYQEYVLGAASAVFHFRQRIRFWDETGKPRQTFDEKTQKWKVSSPGADSVLVAWGDLCADVLIDLDQRQPYGGKTVDMRRGRWW